LVSKDGIRELMGFGINSFIMFIGQQTRDRGPHFAIAGILSIASVTLFQIASQLIQYLNQLQSSLLGVLMPSFTRLFGEGKNDELSKNYLFSLKLSALTASCLCGGIISLGQPFITFWIGPGYEEAYYAVAAMALGYFFVLIHYPSFQLIVALAEHKLFARYEVIEGILLIVGAIAVAPLYGVTGVATVLGITLAISRFFIMPILVIKAWPELQKSLYGQMLKLTFLALCTQGGIFLLMTRALEDFSFFALIPYAFLMYTFAVVIFIVFSTTSSEKTWVKHTLVSLVSKVQGNLKL